MNDNTDDLYESIMRKVILGIIIIASCIWLSIAINYSKVTNNDLIKKATKATRLLYTYTDIENIKSNAEKLEEMCEPYTFSKIDARTPSILTKRFSTYCVTYANIMDVFVDASAINEVYVVIEFDQQTNLDPKLLKFTFNKEGKISDYREWNIGTENYPLDDSKRSLESFLEDRE